MNHKAMYKLSYGLYIVTTRDAEKINGCIVNTAIQAASTPNQICVCINKANYTHDMLLNTGVFMYPYSAGRQSFRCMSGLVFSQAETWINLRIIQHIKMQGTACPISQKALTHTLR